MEGNNACAVEANMHRPPPSVRNVHTSTCTPSTTQSGSQVIHAAMGVPRTMLMSLLVPLLFFSVPPFLPSSPTTTLSAACPPQVVPVMGESGSTPSPTPCTDWIPAMDGAIRLNSSSRCGPTRVAEGEEEEEGGGMGGGTNGDNGREEGGGREWGGRGRRGRRGRGLERETT